MLDGKVWKGIFIGCFFATLVAILSVTARFIVHWMLGDFRVSEKDLGLLLLVAIYTGAIGFAVAFLSSVFVGIPLHLVLRRLGWQSRGAYLLAAGTISGLFALALGLPFALSQGVRNIDVFIIIVLVNIAVGGPIVAAAFCRVIELPALAKKT